MDLGEHVRTEGSDLVTGDATPRETPRPRAMPPHLASLAGYLERRLHELHPQHTFAVSLRDDDKAES